MAEVVTTTTKFGTQPFYDIMHDAGYGDRSFAKACGKSVTIGHVRDAMHGRASPSVALRNLAPKLLEIPLHELFTIAALRADPATRTTKSPRVYYAAEVQ